MVWLAAKPLQAVTFSGFNQPDPSRRRSGLQMLDENLKGYRKKLEVAINEVLTESPKINVAIQDIREGGYDVVLIIEATIGFNKRDETTISPGKNPQVSLELTTQDEKFLKSLKISPD